MIKKTISMAALSVALLLASCGGKKETAASIAQKWCDLNGKAHKAEGAAKEAAEAALNKYENEMEEKYKAGGPYRRRATEPRQNLFGDDRLDQE